MLVKFLGFAAISIAIYGAIALALILSQRPTDLKSDGEYLDFTSVLENQDPVLDLPVLNTVTRDGQNYRVRHLPAPPPAPLLVMVHGSGWHGAQFTRLARALEGQATIVIPNLRGHWQGPGRRGDTGFIGQLEDDLADLITATASPGQRVILLGHSSGGGLVVRFAGGKYREMIDAAILLAPFLHYAAPTTRPNSGGWAHPLTRRIIGLSMLNAVGIHALDGLTAIQFAMPRAVLDGPLGETATTAYSWRLNQSYAPRADYRADIAALPPFALIAGTADQAFIAEGYAPLMRPLTPRGQYQLLPGIGHLAVVDAPETLSLIRGFLQ